MTTIYPGTNSSISTGGTAVVAVPANPNGGIITNPLASTDQNVSAAEVLYVDCVGTCPTLGAYGTIFALQPGQSWTIIAGQATATYVNAASSGHRFSVIYW